MTHDELCPARRDVSHACWCVMIGVVERRVRAAASDEVAGIVIPPLDNYGPVSAAAWMRLEASIVVRGEGGSDV